MEIRCRCSACQALFKVDAKYAGKKARCPQCQAVVDVPPENGEKPQDASAVVSPAPVASVDQRERIPEQEPPADQAAKNEPTTERSELAKAPEVLEAGSVEEASPVEVSFAGIQIAASPKSSST